MHVLAPELQERRTSMPVPESHFVNGAELKPPFPAGLETAVFGMGCFWGVEEILRAVPGIVTTAGDIRLIG